MGNIRTLVGSPGGDIEWLMPIPRWTGNVQCDAVVSMMMCTTTITSQDKINLVESLNWNGGMTNPRGLKVHIGRTHLFLESPCCSRVGDREEFQFDQFLQWPHPMHRLISGESLNKVMFAVWSVLIFFMWIFSHIVQTRGKIWGPEGKGDIMGLKLEMIVLLYSHGKHAVCCHSAILIRVKDPLTPEFSPLCSCVTKTQPTNPSHPGSKLYCFKTQICRPTLREKLTKL